MYVGLFPRNQIVENLSLEPALQRELSNMCLRSLDSVELTIPPHVRRVQEFFLLMAVCNTVVVSYIHEDLVMLVVDLYCPSFHLPLLKDTEIMSKLSTSFSQGQPSFNIN